MTAIGKIFVIVNLLFSLIVAGLIVVVYAKSTNWADAAKKWEQAAKVADASREAAKEEAGKAQAASAAEITRLQGELQKKDGEIAAVRAEVQAKLKEMEAIRQASNKDSGSLVAKETQLEKHKSEVAALEKQVSDKDKQIVALIEAKNKANDDKVAADIRANSYQTKAERMEARLRETESEIVKLRRGGGAGAGGVALVSTANPPPQAVEGIITETMRNSDLVKISVGSDAGLVKGHTLDVFRLKPTPQYLGQIRLTDVRASEAVGQPVDRLKYPAQKGDFVANDVATGK
jgi:hypothetical protein